MDQILDSRCQITDEQRSKILEKTNHVKIIKLVERLVCEELDINSTDSIGATLFYVVCQEREFEVSEYLLDIGANPNIIPPNGMPAWSFILLDP